MSGLGAITGSNPLQTTTSSTSSGAPVVDEANLPAAIRNGTEQQKKDYQTALSFESVLVGQLTKSMMATTGLMDKDASSDSGSDSSFSNDASTQMLKQTLPDTLASAIMNNGGLGLAQQLDTSYPSATATSLSQGSKTGAVSAGTADATAAPATTTDASTSGASTDAGQGGATA